MAKRAILFGLMLLAGLAAGQEDGKTQVQLRRDLTRLPAGKYEIVQTHETRGAETLERPGAKAEKAKPTRASNTFTFDMVVKPPLAIVTVRRIQIQVEGEQVLAYDSDGPAEKQSSAFREQFRHLVGRTSRADLAAFGKGAGFVGLDEAWKDYLKENPDHRGGPRITGDGRLDRMFTQGLDVLFGPDAGRADGRARKLKTGQVFQVTLEEPGIGREPTALEHECTVQSVKDGKVALLVTWKENGHRPTVEDGVITVRGGDMKSSTTMTFHAESGLLVGLVQEVRRTDQVAEGMPPTQRTARRTQRAEFTCTRVGDR